MKNRYILDKNSLVGVRKGVEKLREVVVGTLGPYGRNVLYRDDTGEIRSTKDGVTVAKFAQSQDPLENLGIDIVKQAAIRTANLAGDGTTTSVLLASEILRQTNKHSLEKVNIVKYKAALERYAQELLSIINSKIVRKIKKDQLKAIATISANGDEVLGGIIADAMNRVGLDGVVFIEESTTGETTLEQVEGMQFNRGYKSPFFVTDNNTMTAVLNEPYILIYDGKLTQAKEMLGILEYVATQKKSLLIVADDIDGEALATLIVNKTRGVLQVAAVKAPDFGDRKKLILEDIACLTGGVLVSKDTGYQLSKFSKDWLGTAAKCTVTKDKTTIIDGKGDTEKLQERLLSLKSQLDLESTPFGREKIQERISNFAGGVCVVKLGGNSEIEVKEKKDRAEDALYATRAAVEEGIIPGGGVVLHYAFMELIMPDAQASLEDQLAFKTLREVCKAPFLTLLINAGYQPDTAVKALEDLTKEFSKSKEDEGMWYGMSIDSQKLTFEKDMAVAGIIDPYKVIKYALEHSVSVACTLLLTGGILLEKEEESEKEEDNLLLG